MRSIYMDGWKRERKVFLVYSMVAREILCLGERVTSSVVQYLSYVYQT